MGVAQWNVWELPDGEKKTNLENFFLSLITFFQN